MTKYIFLLICSFGLSSLNGMTTFEKQMDSIPQAEFDQLITDLNFMPTKTSNGEYSVCFRDIILKNYVKKEPVFTNWFAACATLAGIFDQVLIDQEEVMQKAGYWDKFAPCYNLMDLEILRPFHLEYSPLTLSPASGKELFYLLNRVGPVVLAAPGVDKALVITEVTCNDNFDCHVHAIDYAPHISNSSQTQSSEGTLVPVGTKVPLHRRKGYSSIGKVGSGTEIRLTMAELHSKFNRRVAPQPGAGFAVKVYVIVDRLMKEKAQAIKMIPK